MRGWRYDNAVWLISILFCTSEQELNEFIYISFFFLIGLLLGQKDLSFLARAYAAFFVAVPYCMLRVKKAALSSENLMSISSVWRIFLFYQLTRGSIWILRLLQLNSRIKRDVTLLKSSWYLHIFQELKNWAFLLTGLQNILHGNTMRMYVHNLNQWINTVG